MHLIDVYVMADVLENHPGGLVKATIESHGFVTEIVPCKTGDCTDQEDLAEQLFSEVVVDED